MTSNTSSFEWGIWIPIFLIIFAVIMVIVIGFNFMLDHIPIDEDTKKNLGGILLGGLSQ